jgi:hypothetical protein
MSVYKVPVRRTVCELKYLALFSGIRLVLWLFLLYLHKYLSALALGIFIIRYKTTLYA